MTKTIKTSYPLLLATVFREGREKHQLSQAEAAEKAGLTQSAWARLELGKGFTLENAAKACRAFDRQLWEIIKETDDRVAALKAHDVVVEYELPPDQPEEGDDVIWVTSVMQLSKLVASATALLSMATLQGLGKSGSMAAGAGVAAAPGVAGALSAGSGAAVGAAVGSVIPVVGVAAGALLGGLLGGLFGDIDEKKSGRKKKKG